MQIKTNPASQRAFAKFLRDFSKDLASQELAIEIARQKLGETWKDRKYREFSVVLQETSRELSKFYQHSARYQDFLARKAAAAERFLNHR